MRRFIVAGTAIAALAVPAVSLVAPSVALLTDIEAGDVGVMLRGDEGWRMMERRRVLGNVRTLKRSKGR